MIKEALQYIVGLSEAKVKDINVDGKVQTYSDKSLYLLHKDIPRADNTVTVTGTGNITFTYQEGGL